MGPGPGTHKDLKDPRPDLGFAKSGMGRPIRSLAGKPVAIFGSGPHMFLYYIIL
jgi:hypothetical protein